MRFRLKRVSVVFPFLLTAACSGESGRQTDGDSASTGASPPVQSTDRAGREATSRATSAPRPTDGARARVVVLGTSLTAGLGLDPALAYTALLQQKADSTGYRVDIVNAGLSGETSAGALRRASWVLDRPAQAIVLEVGANDGLRGVDPDSTYANLVALIAEIRASQPSARILLVQMEAPTNLGQGYTTQFHQAYERVARDAGVPLLPFLLEGVAGNPRLNQGDGIHPNAEGSRLVAATMWRALRGTFAALDSGITSPTTPRP
ncbi:MAG: arylesterase [Gemmatimonas sp.]